MPKTSALSADYVLNVNTDFFVFVDIIDHTQAATGSTKRAPGSAVNNMVWGISANYNINKINPVYTTVNTNSANWNSVYTAYNANSASGQTSNYTVLSSYNIAVNGDKIQTNTSVGGFVIALTANPVPSIGASILIEDGTLTWASNNLTISGCGLNINSGTSNYTANVLGGKLSCTYINTAIGWSIK